MKQKIISIVMVLSLILNVVQQIVATTKSVVEVVEAINSVNKQSEPSGAGYEKIFYTDKISWEEDKPKGAK
jgi:hypothetical protein